ncbi:MAG: hypothetical protein WD605_00670 [Candidatus Paceibacterota bacterium]
MKIIEKNNARRFRQQGMSMNDIARRLGVSKASVSLWVRDIKLTKTQQGKLTARGFSISAIEKRRTNRLANTNKKHQVVVDKAKSEVKQLSKYELLLVGTALYWGEGNKSNRNVAGISNSDPLVIRIMMKFFKEICNVKKEKFRAHVHAYSHSDIKATEQYWSKVSDIPIKQFYRTYTKQSSASKGKRNSLPYGTLQIYVCDTNVALSIKGSLDRLKEISL